MEIKASSIEGFEPSNLKHTFFLDSNVWLYLLFPQHSNIASGLIKKYSALFEKIISKDCIIITDVIQISELVNLILRIEYKKYIASSKSAIDFKKFRTIPEGVKALADAKILIHSITKSSTLLSGIFNSEELKKMAESCDKADFNDIFFASFCQKKDAILVTHDFDFNALNSGLNILSANASYL